ncbi:hypothetical protein LJC17_03670 [Acholeplasma sp. OttesenSCG-928-E16]|nr:hypothetical protein [Acholeplasma sp. OttesenSCG-928-E16]
MKKVCFILAIVFVLLLSACGPDKKKLQDFKDKIEDKISEIKREYDIGDSLPTELSDGTKIQWVISGTSAEYFDPSTYACLGTNNENGTTVEITALFTSKDDSAITYERTIDNIIILDSNIRNSESGIPDQSLYNYLRVIADKNQDGKISKTEAKEVVGAVEIVKDNEGIVASDSIETTKGLHHFPNITNLKFTNLKIKDLVIDGITNLETLEFSNDSARISIFNVKNQSKLSSIKFGKATINSVYLGSPLTVIDLDLSLKNISSFSVDIVGVKVYKLDLSGNQNLTDFSFLSRIESLEYLNLNSCSLNKIKTDSLPSMISLKEFLIADNKNIGVYDFITAAKYPKLEVIDFTSNQIIDLELKDFLYLQKIVLEELQIGDIYHIGNLRLINLPKFDNLARSEEVKILNIYIENLPALKTLDLSAHDTFDNFDILSLSIINSGIESIIKNDMTGIINLYLEDLERLSTLNLIKTGLQNITFKNMDSLETLLLDYCQKIADYSFINGATNLKELSLGNADLSNAKTSSFLTKNNLLKLNVSLNPDLTDYTFLSKFPNLEVLNLRDNGITNQIFKTIPILDKLIELILTDNIKITVLQISDFKSLEILDISVSSDDIWNIETLTLENLLRFTVLRRKENTKISNVILEDLPILQKINLASCSDTLLVIHIKNVPMLSELNIAFNNEVKIN